MSNKEIQYGKVYDVGSDDEEIVNDELMDVVDNNLHLDKTTIELSEFKEPQDNRNYRLLNESIKRVTNPDELIFLPDTDEKIINNQLMTNVRNSSRKMSYDMWNYLIEKGRKIDEDVINMMQNYIIKECKSNNVTNLERCRKYREILDAYWNKNPSLREKQKRIGGKCRSKKYTKKSKRKSTKSNKRRRGKGKFTRK